MKCDHEKYTFHDKYGHTKQFRGAIKARIATFRLIFQVQH